MNRKGLFRGLCAALFFLALLDVALLLMFDVLNQLRLSPVHQQTGALAFILIGASFIRLQMCSGRRWIEILKEVLLGTAFVLWGQRAVLSSPARS